ncbi:MAG: hypothetical protein ACLPUO_04275 [Streptosporangiaceae bacterium]|jgi:cysteinyl-tRNA synthetase
MFRLFDSRRGQVAQITPARGRQLRMYSRGPAADRPADLGDLRAEVLADLIGRNAERHRLSVIACQHPDEAGPAARGQTAARREDAYRADCAALNVRPPDYWPCDPGEVIDIQTGGIDLTSDEDQDDPAHSDPAAGHRVVRTRVQGGRVHFDGLRPDEPAAAAGQLTELSERGLDPLALRLVFLQHHYRQPLTLTWDALTAADEAVRRWRQRVAQWATSPSRPMCRQYTADIAAAFDDDLDIPAALAALAALEADGQIPPGSKFETFAHADRLVALDLAREIGRADPPVTSR